MEYFRFISRFLAQITRLLIFSECFSSFLPRGCQPTEKLPVLSALPVDRPFLSGTLPSQLASPLLVPSPKKYLFVIKRNINPSAVCLRLPASMKIHSAFHVSMILTVLSSPLSPPAVPPSPPQITDDHPAFTVRRIMDVRVLLKTLLRDFYVAQPEKPGRAPRGAR